MEKKARVAVVCLVIVMVAAVVYDFVGAIQPWDTLPEDLNIVYKEIQRRGVIRTEWYVLVTDSGRYCRVTEDIWSDVDVPQKVGDGLYRLPDGTLLGCVEAEGGAK